MQPLPTGAGSAPGRSAPPPAAAEGIDLSRLPTLREIEAMSTDELDELFGLKPKVDIPVGAGRGMGRVGVIDPAEGGLPVFSLAAQPAGLVRAALAGTKGPVISRWGHILLRRALASRLATPAGMDPAEFAALRAGLLGRIGEFAAARALVQDVDTANYTPALTNAAFAAYLGTADILGACPAVRLAKAAREDAEWRMTAAICGAYSGEAGNANRDLRRIMSRGDAARIDALLAQRLAGAAGDGRRAVTIEWDGVTELTPWRFALANAVGAEVPGELLQAAGRYYALAGAVAPMLTPAQRLLFADTAARAGVLSSAALVDLHSELFAEGEDGSGLERARQLRAAYLGNTSAARMAAIKALWGADGAEVARDPYGRWVLTAEAAARLAPSEDFATDAGPLVGSMLAAGYDRDAARWADIVEDGSLAWALIAVSRADAENVGSGAIGDFVDADDSRAQRKSAMLVAGLAALGRTSEGVASDYGEDLGFDLARRSRWTQAISGAAAGRNQVLVVLLAGLGMQGESWEQMTALHLFHIVRALDQVGLGAEARMIAAEAVARA
ncbi:hypothetical protein [Qipengyuania sediminis]|uniref:hypothetical protein n=1 Tax=Qipengyuania sediminis TaxID=1532023 RepID=UPI001F104386|nr:hypothetical protein [Qipengyuania sediminis]